MTTVDAPLDWRAESLWEALSPLLPGLSVEVVRQCPSTNTALLERARAAVQAPPEAGEAGIQVRRSVESRAFGSRASDTLPCLLVAEHQTGGRGRMGRTWTAAPGASLTFSLSLPMAPRDWSGLSLVVGTVLAEALQASSAPGSAPRIGLKWPNDLWLDGRKLGGILILNLFATQAQRSRQMSRLGFVDKCSLIVFIEERQLAKHVAARRATLLIE